VILGQSKGLVGRGSRIRTCDLEYPKLPRYQTALYPARVMGRNTHAGDALASIHASADSGNVSRRRAERRFAERLRCRFDNQRINARRENAFRRPDGPLTPTMPLARGGLPEQQLSNCASPTIDRLSATPLMIRRSGFSTADDDPLAGCSTRTMPCPHIGFDSRPHSIPREAILYT
jgi:hypothetical protein